MTAFPSDAEIALAVRIVRDLARREEVHDWCRGAWIPHEVEDGLWWERDHTADCVWSRSVAWVRDNPETTEGE